jgi:formylglycine-generating enzyme required for sulfatase activity
MKKRIRLMGIIAIMAVIALSMTVLSLTGCDNGGSGGGGTCTNHSWGEWDVTTAPTCTTAGVGTRACTICETADPNTVIPPAGHNFVSGFCTRTSCFMIEMANIPAGNFVRDTHTITLSAFRMSKFQVTQELYEAVMGNNPSWFQGTEAGKVVTAGEIQGKRPVETVNWYDAIVFCNRLSVREGLTPAYRINGSTNPADWGAVPYYCWDDDIVVGETASWDAVEIVSGSTGYRLPTEAQWEYACRAGSTTTWHFGNDENLLAQYAWYGECCCEGGRTHQVGLKQPNGWGLHDMHGNVWEWCWDWWGTFPDPGNLNNPTGPIDGVDRVLRGGGWYNSAWRTQSSFRIYDWPSYGGSSLGFRLVCP